jgi:flagellar basal body-associated protein FliL
MNSKGYPENSRSDIQPEKKKKKGGPIIAVYIIIGMAAAMGLGAVYYNYRKDKEKTYLSDPKKGDVYEMVMTSGRFSTAKIIHITKDSIYVTANNYETDKREGMSEIMERQGNYGVLFESYSKKQVEKLFAQDSIFAIDRD